MNTKTTAIVILLGLVAATAVRAEDAKGFKDEKEKISYAIGFDTGSRMKQQDIQVDYDTFVRGLKDAAGGTPRLTDQELRETFDKLRQEIRSRMEEKRRELTEKNRKEGEDFLAANKTKPGVVTLTNGLQYIVLAEGSGPSPKPEDTVTVNYRGTLIDGTEFDHSHTNEPATFAANRVIKGWTEALTRMKAGSKWKLFIPADLAYGLMGHPPKIGPNATLVFEVELISFKPPAPAANAHPPTPITSDIIKVPSLEEMKKGAKIETIKAEDVERLQREQQAQQQKEKK